MNKKSISRMGFYLALAMILSYLEFVLPLPMPIPGIKLGLANLIVIMPLYLSGFWEAAAVSISRVLLVGFTFGSIVSIAYSMSGAVFSLCIMYFMKKSSLFSPIGVSIGGGIFHNVGQIVMAFLIVHTVGLFYYMPILLISGSLTGFVVGFLANLLLKTMGKQDKIAKKRVIDRY